MPAGGDDLPQSEDGLGPSPPAALTVSSSDEDEEEVAADAGYQPLPTEPNDDIAEDSETEAGITTAESSSSTAEAFSSCASSNIVLHSSHLPLVHCCCQAYILFYSIVTSNELQHWVLALDS